MTTITTQDREAAEKLFDGALWHMGSYAEYMMPSDRAEAEDVMAEAFAAHRLATIEECARIADRHDTGDCTREDMEARRIAGEIRQLGEEA